MGTRPQVSCSLSQVESVLPSSTTTISCGTLCKRSSTYRCSTVEAMQPSSSRAGMTMLNIVNGGRSRVQAKSAVSYRPAARSANPDC